MRASAAVQAFLSAGPHPLIRFLISTESEPAETRKGVRVSAAGSGLTADIGQESECPLVDISTIGFGVIAAAVFKVGAVAKATLSYKGDTFSGQVCVRSAFERDDGTYRYGCEALAGEHNLRHGLQLISSSLQRDQLFRLAEGR